MILIVLFIGIVIFVCGLLFLETKMQRSIVGSIGFIILIASAALMLGNDNWHWGMHQGSTTKTVKIASVSTSKELSVLVYQPIKKAKTERVYVYTLKGQSKQRHTPASLKTTNRVTYRNVDQASMATKTTTWRYDNSFWKFLFSWTGTHHELVSRQVTFTLPKDWVTLSTSQAKWLATTAAQKEKTAKTAIATAVATEVKTAVAADPTMTTAEIAQVKSKAEAAAEKQAEQQTASTLAALIKQAKQRSIY
ncbi:DUF4811 domain-containing protein [Lactiplantibacillus herbarum]|uniref:DUF4811 domain-containing protein n=1 Tax=Lactiplantibacillus herbarum TaxID=1670446 RepID=UPI00064F5636|nr:DUF4811 domain-containing protein [Lactiplantibacillus herbarum]